MRVRQNIRRTDGN